jgi:hypothetical protein
MFRSIVLRLANLWAYRLNPQGEAMMFFSKFSLMMAFAGLMAATMGHAETGKKKTAVATPHGSSSCPVAMEAKHGADGSVVAVRGSERSGPGQELELTLRNARLGEISAIRITAHGWDGKGRTLPTQNAASTHGTASKTVNVKVSVGPRASEETNVWVKGMTAVDSIDLVGVNYADGSSWKAATPGACRVVPDPATLISQK